MNLPRLLLPLDVAQELAHRARVALRVPPQVLHVRAACIRKHTSTIAQGQRTRKGTKHCELHMTDASPAR